VARRLTQHQQPSITCLPGTLLAASGSTAHACCYSTAATHTSRRLRPRCCDCGSSPAAAVAQAPLPVHVTPAGGGSCVGPPAAKPQVAAQRCKQAPLPALPACSPPLLASGREGLPQGEVPPPAWPRQQTYTGSSVAAPATPPHPGRPMVPAGWWWWYMSGLCSRQ
jgi:hypothetical protein